MIRFNGFTRAAAVATVGVALALPAAASAHDRRAQDAIVGGLVGALAGGLIGGDATGAVVGAGAGALLGVAVAGHGGHDYGYGRYDAYRGYGDRGSYGGYGRGYGVDRGGYGYDSPRYGEYRTDYRTGGYGGYGEYGRGGYDRGAWGR